MTIATETLINALGVAIPLVIVFGIFVVSPVAWSRRRRVDALASAAPNESLQAIAESQARILDHLTAMQTRLDEIDRVLATVD